MTKNLFDAFESDYFCPKCDSKLVISLFKAMQGIRIVECPKCNYCSGLEYHKVLHGKKKKN
jgi:uncharacterized metal-binding protein (TIGR02443 family)